MRFLVIFVLVCFLFPAYSVAAQDDPVPVDLKGDPVTEEKEDSEEGEKGEKKAGAERYRVLPIPIFITEPAIGEGLGVALALFHPVKGGKQQETRVATMDSIGDFPGERQAPPVVTALAGAYTNNDTWFAGVGHSNNFRNDSIRYVGGLAAARVNSRIYVGNLPLTFSMESAIVYQELKFRVGNSDFLLGAGFSYLDADNRFGISIPDGLDDNPFATEFTNSGAAVKLAYETRDNTMSPRQGQLVEASLWRYDEAIGGDYDYWSAKLKALSFHQLGEKVTLGFRAEVSGVDGRVPFFAYPFVSLRGIPALRYQNKVAGAVEFEGRYLIRPRWEVSVFGGLGYASDDLVIFDNPDSLYNFGLGGRYKVFNAHNVWMGLDIARGPEDWNWYIQVGHPW
jgi:hypothetical protein